MSHFRTIEISDPFYEVNGLRFITVKSKHLKGRGDICLFVPEDGAYADLPLLILLHGVYGSSWAWALKGGAHVTAQKMIRNTEIAPLAIAMPSDGLWGDGSAYLEHNGRNYEKWIVEDVVQAVRETAPCGAGSPVFIGGLSMGGFGAIAIGAKHPNVFRGISAHSSITRLKEFSAFVEEPLHNYGAENQNLDLARLLVDNRQQLPLLRFDCGENDDLFESNVALHHELLQQNIAHDFKALEGTHDWEYWKVNIQHTLRFVSQNI